MSSEDQRSEELIKQVKKQVALEERAHRVVEKLIEITASEEYLKDALPCITSCQYSDVVVERAIAKLCGYPVCRNTLTAVSNQKYQISLKNKTVYDISDRKNFCSNKCYSASKHLQDQIPSEPVWLRGDGHCEPITFLADDVNKGCAGTVVISGHRQHVVDEGQVVEMLDSLLVDDDSDNGESSSDISEDVTDDIRPSIPVHKQDNDSLADVADNSHLPVTSRTQDTQSITPDSELEDKKPLTRDMLSTDSHLSSKAVKWNSSGQFQRGLFKSCVVDISLSPVESASELHQSSAMGQRSLTGSDDNSGPAVDHHTTRKLHMISAAEQTTLQRVKNCLYEWKTAELLAFLRSSCSRELDTGISSKVNTNRDVSVAEDVNKDSRESSTDKRAEGEKLYERRVGEFYGMKPRVHFADSCKQEAEDDDKEIVLASVHSCSQNSLRRKIVLEKLSNVVPRLLESTSLHLSDISTALRDLVHCFRLTSHNITLKSTEWSVVGYVVLRILAIGDKTVHSALKSEAAMKTASKLLSSAAITASDIDEIVHELQSQFAEGAIPD